MQGQVINGFVLKKLLGRGGMAEVWYAENEIGKPAAVKILNENLSYNQQIVERFHNEALVMVKLDHPNIRQVYGYGYLGNRHGIIMEYLEGQDLEELLKKGRHFTDEELRRWWNQTVDALNFTHAMGVVHRDIKPSNLFLDKRGNIKLLDFGISKIRESISMTQTGSMMGTLLYMSPEQVKDPKRVDYRTDMYSLAMTFVHLLTGEAPYDCNTTSDFEIQLSIVTKPLDLSGLPEKWRLFLEPYLEKEPDNRPKLAEYNEIVSKPQVETTATREEIVGVIEPKQGSEGTPVDKSAPTIVAVQEQESIQQEQVTNLDQEKVTPLKKVAESVKTLVEEKLKIEEKPTEVEEPVEEPLPFVANGVTFNMLKVKGGEYTMGASSGDLFRNDQVKNYDADARDDERPVHGVSLTSFYMAETEVTQELWKAVMGTNLGWESRYGLGDNYPVYLVSWEKTQDFIKKLNEITGEQFRLPTEAEWEYAARGGKKADGCKYAGSNELDKAGWFADNSGGSTHPVKQKLPNAVGLYDMSGNVWEWCHDKYGSYRRIKAYDPQGPSSGNDQVLRGGSWRDKANYCRVSSRSFFTPINSYNGYGFRLALDYSSYYDDRNQVDKVDNTQDKIYFRRP